MGSNPSILVLNSGSSSIKFSFFEGERALVHGQISGLGIKPTIHFTVETRGTTVTQDLPAAQTNHETALGNLLELLATEVRDVEIAAIGHRVVHGGPEFSQPTRIDADILCKLEDLVPLAPLHQPHNLAGIRAAMATFPHALQVACFDTAFHRGHPWVNDTFALPRSHYEEGIRRYGFHGLSYEYICNHLKSAYPELYKGRVIVAHLGNGASMCAINQGQSIDSTMGFTALDGLPMGTRCGQLDPGVLLYLLTAKAMSPTEISDLLYKNSGLMGLSGESSDMRDLLQSTNPSAREAIDYYVARIRREIGSLSAALNGLDGLVFTGGIGENAPQVRQKVCTNQEWLGMTLDESKNIHSEPVISSADSRVQILVVPTNEEEMIRKHTVELMQTS